MPKKFKDITCQKFGKLTAVYRLHNYHKKDTHWLCFCECGNFSIVTMQNLKKAKSCFKCRKPSNLKHGKVHTRLYHIWSGIKKRCCNNRDPTYKDYGARGIQICETWLNDFETFYKWAIDNNYHDNLTIDRIDVNGDYEPSNCRWTDRYTQNVNTRRELYGIVLHEYNSLEYFSIKYGTPRQLARTRFLQYHWSFEDSILTPICKDRSYKRYSQYEHN